MLRWNATLRKAGVPVKARNLDDTTVQKKSRIPKRTIRKRKAKRKATPQEQAHMNRVGKLPCIACLMDGNKTRANLHHIRTEYGTSQRASHWETIPLCEGHHQGQIDNTKPVAIHRAERTFVIRYCNEVQMLKTVWDSLGLDFETLPILRGEDPPWWDGYQRGIYDQQVDVQIRLTLVMED